MRLTSKGQVTIPQDIRDRLGLHPWTEVQFEVVGNAVRITKRAGTSSRGRRLVDALRRAPKPRRGMTTDQLMALTRGD